MYVNFRSTARAHIMHVGGWNGFPFPVVVSFDYLFTKTQHVENELMIVSSIFSFVMVIISYLTCKIFIPKCLCKISRILCASISIINSRADEWRTYSHYLSRSKSLHLKFIYRLPIFHEIFVQVLYVSFYFTIYSHCAKCALQTSKHCERYYFLYHKVME